MLYERIKTSFLVPKVIFYTSIGLVMLTVVLGFMFLTVDATTIINESSFIIDDMAENLGMSDELTVILNGG